MFKPGQSGNPAGRPKNSKSVTGIIRDLSKVEDATGQTLEERIARKLLELAEGGEQWAVKEFIERMDGKTVAKIETDITSNGKPLGARIQFIGSPSEIIDTEARELEEDTDKLLE